MTYFSNCLFKSIFVATFLFNCACFSSAREPIDESLARFIATVQRELPQMIRTEFADNFSQLVSARKHLSPHQQRYLLDLEENYFKEIYIPHKYTAFMTSEDSITKTLETFFEKLVGLADRYPRKEINVILDFPYHLLKTYFPGSGLKDDSLYFDVITSFWVASEFNKESTRQHAIDSVNSLLNREHVNSGQQGTSLSSLPPTPAKTSQASSSCDHNKKSKKSLFE